MSDRLRRKQGLGIVIASMSVFFITILLLFFLLGNPSQSAARQYGVTFEQVGLAGGGNCSFFGEPWAVAIGDKTQVQPPNTKLPLDSSLEGTLDKNITLIIFLLPDGSYHYRVLPGAFFFEPAAGNVSVNGSDVRVQITYTGHGCLSTTSTTSSQGT